jgi:hypothetical protein
VPEADQRGWKSSAQLPLVWSQPLDLWRTSRVTNEAAPAGLTAEFSMAPIAYHFAAESDGVGEACGISASMALDYNAVQSEKYGSVGRAKLLSQY